MMEDGHETRRGSLTASSSGSRPRGLEGAPQNTRHAEGGSDEAENIGLEALEVKGKVKTQKVETK